MSEKTRILAGDCTVRFEGTRDRIQRGHVVILVKPDRTVLVHDADGYQPVAWLTRPDDVTIEHDGEGFSLRAHADSQELLVTSNSATGLQSVAVSEAGVPVGTCPDCEGPLVRTRGEIRCLDCEDRYGIPTGATVLDSSCADCGLPQMRVDRGDSFELCVDYGCESLSTAVHERFDEEWDCPDCGSSLKVRSPDGRIFLGCDGYPNCETSFSFPSGLVVDDCECGLPRFRTASGERCLDGGCEAMPESESPSP
ncbi:DNA topoisomerase-1 [Halohasta litchfieldiae]|jgi:DNA topoisomerase-1|uniref:DNA topoisomerase-1 n=1 Tax=Halohasta litchfieldiae TaxID=1073996 RepID=A0A1H6TNN1_9EURY|nr:topoisomerase DNA-binding C4 zinc finger domain-containing protein [Halohasta litchfieldiae]ATW88908.1 DNA topoisomerase-1 [Halohasta litchfieldiae]SEI80906.1 DNA topoisomerase-1 [Halohasta litchfieldiae]